MILSAVSAAELSTKLREVFTVPGDTFSFKECIKINYAKLVNYSIAISQLEIY